MYLFKHGRHDLSLRAITRGVSVDIHTWFLTLFTGERAKTIFDHLIKCTFRREYQNNRRLITYYCTDVAFMLMSVVC